MLTGIICLLILLTVKKNLLTMQQPCRLGWIITIAKILASCKSEQGWRANSTAPNGTAGTCMGRTFLEGPAAPSESRKNREHVTRHSKSLGSTLCHFQLIKSKAGAFIMWILVSEIPLPLSEIPLPPSEIPLTRSGIPLHRSGFSLTRSGIPLPHNPIDTRVAYTIQYEFISGKLHFTSGKWNSTSPKWNSTSVKWNFTSGKWNFT